MKQVTTYVRIDADEKDLFIAMLVGRATTPTTWTVPNEPNAIRRLVRKLEREASGPVQVCYEAGPCGYVLKRPLSTARVTCQVIAPALIPRKPGEQLTILEAWHQDQSARRAEAGELLRAGLLTEVRPPTPAEEAGRKTDVNDAMWIADLLAHGLIRSSFVPPAAVHELRDLTRTRKQLVREVSQLTLRIQKVLEDANLKLTSVISDIMG